jgi:hypothetical protein
MRRIGDRRSALRLDVVGDLWGTLEVHKQARVRDLNHDGALLEYPVAVVPETVHAVTFAHDGHRISLEVRVRHVRPGRTPDGRIVFLAGVEFLSAPTAFPELVAGVS